MRTNILLLLLVLQCKSMLAQKLTFLTMGYNKPNTDIYVVEHHDINGNVFEKDTVGLFCMGYQDSLLDSQYPLCD